MYYVVKYITKYAEKLEWLNCEVEADSQQDAVLDSLYSRWGIDAISLALFDVGDSSSEIKLLNAESATFDDGKAVVFDTSAPSPTFTSRDGGIISLTAVEGPLKKITCPRCKGEGELLVKKQEGKDYNYIVETSETTLVDYWVDANSIRDAVTKVIDKEAWLRKSTKASTESYRVYAASDINKSSCLGEITTADLADEALSNLEE